MAADVKKPLYLVLGFVDYMQDRLEELHQELLERGEERSEDLREFLDDVLENFPMLMKSRDEEAGDDEVMESDEAEATGFLANYGLSSSREAVRDLLEGLGLATDADLEDIHEKLDRMQETVKNLIKSSGGGKSTDGGDVSSGE